MEVITNLEHVMGSVFQSISNLTKLNNFTTNVEPIEIKERIMNGGILFVDSRNIVRSSVMLILSSDKTHYTVSSLVNTASGMQLLSFLANFDIWVYNHIKKPIKGYTENKIIAQAMGRHSQWEVTKHGEREGWVLRWN